jgi:hypothetical protein
MNRPAGKELVIGGVPARPLFVFELPLVFDPSDVHRVGRFVRFNSSDFRAPGWLARGRDARCFLGSFGNSKHRSTVTTFGDRGCGASGLAIIRRAPVLPHVRSTCLNPSPVDCMRRDISCVRGLPRACRRSSIVFRMAHGGGDACTVTFANSRRPPDLPRRLAEPAGSRRRNPPAWGAL